jgi:hypothetical protein
MCLASSPHPKIPQIAAIQGIIWGKHYKFLLPTPPHKPRQAGKPETWKRQPGDSQVKVVIHKLRYNQNQNNIVSKTM